MSFENGLAQDNLLNNQQAFEHLVIMKHQEKNREVHSIDGLITPKIKASIQIDTTAQYSLIVGQPEIRFNRIEKKKFSRQIHFELSYLDSIPSTDNIISTDTLEIKKWRELRRTKFAALRGHREDNSSKLLLPLSLIVLGVAGILSLFYIRS